MDEKTFLRNYDIHEFDIPLVSVDGVLFTYADGQLKVLLVKRSEHPEKGKWGLPGGFVNKDLDNDLEDTVRRKISEKTGVNPPYIEQLQSYGNARRDKRGWSVTVCYSALIAHQDCAAEGKAVSEIRWVEIEEALRKKLAFDHRQIITDARERLRQKALYSIIPAYALPKSFTLPELQQVHECLIGKPLQKKSFRRRIEQAGLLVDTGQKRAEGGRPATLYRLAEKAGSFTFLRNLEDC